MATFVLGSLVVPVRAGPIEIRHDDVALTYRDRWDGTVEVSQRGPHGRTLRWPLVTIPMSRTAADTLRTQLLAAGTQEVSGDAVAVGVQTAYVVNIQRADQSVGGGAGTNDRCTLSFEAVGVDA